MSEFAREILIGTVTTIVGSLLGSLGTIVAFRGSLIRLEERLASLTLKVGELKTTAEKASRDANRAWEAIREMTGYAKGVTGEVPKFVKRDSGEGPSNG